MKKILSLTLVLVLVLSMMAGVAVTVSADEAGEFIVAEFDFENGLDGFQSYHGSTVDLVEESENKYMSIKVDKTPEEIIAFAATRDIQRIGRDYLVMGFTKELSIPADSSKNYFFRANAKWENGSDGVLGELITTHGGQYWPTFSSECASDKEGWTIFETTVISSSYITGENFTRMYLKTNLASELCDAMAVTASYNGTGIGNNFNNWKMTIDGTEYDFADDCSAVGADAETKAANLKAYLEANPVGYYIDDIQLITSGVATYTDTVTVNGADADVTAIVNPNVSDGTVAVTNGGAVTVNDYYGTTYNVTTGEAVVTATYNGEAVEVSQDGNVHSFTIAPEDVTADGEVVITASTPAEENNKVTGITLDKTSTELEAGETETLIATVLPENATDKSITWSSSNESVATVVNGVVTAVGEGTATIIAETSDGGFTASCDVTVKYSISSEQLDFSMFYDVYRNSARSLAFDVTAGNGDKKTLKSASSLRVVQYGVSNGAYDVVACKNYDMTVSSDVNAAYSLLSTGAVGPYVAYYKLQEGSDTLIDTICLAGEVYTADGLETYFARWAIDINAVYDAGNSMLGKYKLSENAVIFAEDYNGYITVDKQQLEDGKNYVVSVFEKDADGYSRIVAIKSGSHYVSVENTIAVIKSITSASDVNGYDIYKLNMIQNGKEVTKYTVDKDLIDNYGTGTIEDGYTEYSLELGYGFYPGAAIVYGENVKGNITDVRKLYPLPSKIGEAPSEDEIPYYTTEFYTLWNLSRKKYGYSENCEMFMIYGQVTEKGDATGCMGVESTCNDYESIVYVIDYSSANITVVDYDSPRMVYVGTTDDITEDSYVLVRKGFGETEDIVVYKSFYPDKTKYVGTESVSLNKTSTVLEVGETETLIATVLPENATDKSITWSSSNESVATVVNGVVTAVCEGTATIIAETSDGGFSASCVITITNPADPDAPEITLSNAVKKKIGDTFTIDVNLENNTGFSSIGIDIGHNADVLELVSAEPESGIGASFTTAEQISSNPYNMNFDNTNNVTYNGKLATLTFRVKEGAADGVYPISVSYYKGRYGNYTDGYDVNYDEDYNPLGLTYSNGSVTVVSYIPGDINGDGTINNRDATTILRYLAGWNIDIH